MTDVALTSLTTREYDDAYVAHWHDVYRFALAWTNDRGAAEDLAQEAFVRLWKSRARVNWDQPILGWLLITTRRLATDRFRSTRRWLRSVASSRFAEEDTWNEWLDVRTAMGRLSPLERTAIVLTALEGHSYAEAGVILGTTPGALRAAVSRARAKLEVA